MTLSHRDTLVLPHLGHSLKGCLAINPQSSHSQLGTLNVKYLHPTSAAYFNSFLYCSIDKCESRLRCAELPPSRLSPQKFLPCK